MVAEMHSETDPDFTPKISRNQTPRTSKTMIPLERGINFNEIQGSLKGLHFDSILDVFSSSLDTMFCSFTWLLRVREHVQKNTEKVPQKCPKDSPRRFQRGPKIHQKSLKIGPCSQMAPQGHPGMPLGTPGPPKSSPGTSKVTIWDLKSYHFTLISNYVSYQNSKKCNSFPLFFVVFGCSFRR